MATIYRFIIEQNTSGKSSGRNTQTKTKSSGKTKTITLLGSAKGGVEHNRKLRAINPLLNKLTGGVWEKGMRVGRAGLGILKFNQETGAIAGVSGVAIAVIISFAIQEIFKWQNREREKANKLNTQNYKALESGHSSVHGAYEVSANGWNGRLSYNQNK